LFSIRCVKAEAVRIPELPRFNFAGRLITVLSFLLMNLPGRTVCDAMRSQEHLSRTVPPWRFVAGIGALAAIAFALALAVSPQLHERIHRDAAQAGHECAVTLIATGKYEHAPVLPLIILPEPAILFAIIPALNPVWVPAPFLDASIFEHAPPALS
jgi:hypothetical protein